MSDMSNMRNEGDDSRANDDDTTSYFNQTEQADTWGTNLSTKVRTADALDSEFRYYSKLVPDLIFLLSHQEDRENILPWVHKLSSPGYNVIQLRDKRNRFMLMLCMTLILDDLRGPFVLPPPAGVLPDILRLIKPEVLPFEWELDRMWERQAAVVREIHQADNCKPPIQRCHLHRTSCPKDTQKNKSIGETLDRQFRFLLYISKPYAAMLSRSSDRIRAAKWIQMLCCVDSAYCAVSKGIRNDYMMVLAGYLANQSLVGPFQDYPLERLLPLSEIAFMKNDNKCIIDPTNPKTTEFFNDVPHPQEGAFAYIAVTGDLCRTKF